MSVLPVGFGGQGAAKATIVFTARSENVSTGSSYTFTGVSIGTASASRYVVVTVSSGDGSSSASTVTALTIGGVSATKLVEANPTDRALSMWGASVPTGTTANIAITYTGTNFFTGIGVWALYNVSTTPHDTGFSTSSPASDTINVQAKGVAVAGSFATGSGTTMTWAGLTEVFDSAIGGNSNHSGASQEFATAQTGMTVSATPSGGSFRSMVTASFSFA